MKICVKQRPFIVKKNKYILRSGVPSETELGVCVRSLESAEGSRRRHTGSVSSAGTSTPPVSVEGSWEEEKRQGGDEMQMSWIIWPSPETKGRGKGSLRSEVDAAALVPFLSSSC